MKPWRRTTCSIRAIVRASFRFGRRPFTQLRSIRRKIRSSVRRRNAWIGLRDCRPHNPKPWRPRGTTTDRARFPGLIFRYVEPMRSGTWPTRALQMPGWSATAAFVEAPPTARWTFVESRRVSAAIAKSCSWRLAPPAWSRTTAPARASARPDETRRGELRADVDAQDEPCAAPRHLLLLSRALRAWYAFAPSF